MKISKNKIKQEFKEKWIWIILLVSLICFFAIAEDVCNQDIIKLDTITYRVVVENARNNFITPLIKLITNLGGIYVIVAITILSIIYSIRKKNKSIGILIGANLAIITCFNLLIKNIVQRPRPDGYRLIPESGYSFPSGHSMVSTAFYGLIIYLIYKNVKNKYLRNILCITLSIIIPLIGLSRVYLGVHYASDVIAGFTLSIAYLICFIKISNYIKKKGEKHV